MLRHLTKFILLSGLVLGGSVALWQYEKKWSEQAKQEQRIRRLEEEKQQLQRFVARLTSEKRVAEIVVTDQAKTGDQIESTTLLFVEYDREGKQLPPQFFTIKGNVAHIDALVIKFEKDFVRSEDPLRGHSLVLFYRLYGDYQTPADGYRIDQPGAIPEIYQDETATTAAQAFEQELWKNFWKLADDVKYRQEKGVSVAMGEGPWTYFYPDKVYQLTLAAAGGLSINSRPLDGVWKEYRSALKRTLPNSK
jgi:hypothetical protein